ncbi:zinc carboxypeptidase A 1-like [Epargyreus clarus]|uniref:zinc carboxypeptidase A 1-like n=1 Tax=Epargyreus clarus TaxID=520877 RepID=UPI003C2EBE4F
MLETLVDRDEAECIENAALGTSTITIFLKALKQFCGDIVDVRNDYRTYEGRHLYEVSIKSSEAERQDTGTIPIILIEAGQQGGIGPVDLALYIIEQLVACKEYNDMIEKAHWVILPCTNPDGFEYVRYNRESWHKNFRPTNDNMTYGVDISRNFNESWNICPNPGNSFSQDYGGDSPASENETLFMINVFNKYRGGLKAYLSLRRDGHSILYPFASINGTTDIDVTRKKAGDIAAKVNYRAGVVQWFVNDSIFNMNGKPHCGHSVDYMFINHHIPYSYEMRVFLESDRHVLNKFQKLPPGYKVSLRNGYFSGIRELYNVVHNENKRNIF